MSRFFAASLSRGCENGLPTDDTAGLRRNLRDPTKLAPVPDQCGLADGAGPRHSHGDSSATGVTA